MEASGDRTFRPEHVTAALKAASGARQDYCRAPYEEFRQAALLPLARRVAEAFVASAETPAERRLIDATLNEAVTYEGGHNDMMFLIATGHVWQDSPETLSWTPGIPGLVGAMIENIRAP